MNRCFLFITIVISALANADEPLFQPKFVLVIQPKKTNHFLKENLEMVLHQNYPCFRVIYFDPYTTEKRHDILQSTIENSNPQKIKVELIENYQKSQTAIDLISAIHQCMNDEIIYLVEEKFEFSDIHFLKKLNHYFDDSNNWAFVSNSMGTKSRKYSSLKCFYAGLFKRIKIADLMQDGNFFIPDNGFIGEELMLDMAKDHIGVIDENTTIRIRGNTYAKTYESLKIDPRLPFEFDKNDCADILVFSYNRPLQLYAFLESLKRYASNVGSVFVLYRSSNASIEDSYKEVAQAFSETIFIKQSHEKAHEQFKPFVLSLLFNNDETDSRYIAFAVDDIIIKEEIDFTNAIHLLKQYDAYGFYFRLGNHINYCYMLDIQHGLPDPFFEMKNEVCLWRFDKGESGWNYPNNLDFTLYSKEKIKPAIESISFNTPNEFEAYWHLVADHSQIGICFKNSKIVNLPLNIVSEFNNRCNYSYSAAVLEDFFNQGMKIDIEIFRGIKNTSPHLDYDVKFTNR